MTTLWTRGQLKDHAKEKLRTFYWQAFLVCLIALLLGAGTDSVFRVRSRRNRETGGGTQIYIGGRSDVRFSYGQDEQVSINTPVYSVSVPGSFGGIVILMALVIGIAVLAISILISNVVLVGKKRYFLKKTIWDHEAGIGELFSGFREGYGNLVLAMFRRDISILLWSLLFLIPGVIKSYEYYMVPYLLAVDPLLSWEEARKRSSDMMEGNKFSVFILELSFIGWDIAGLLLCGVGQIFVYPYKEMVYAELYRTLTGSERMKEYGV